ncbi:MAG: hypothetical protein ACLFP8_09115 [Alphaproteobacteria bacterium]
MSLFFSRVSKLSSGEALVLGETVENLKHKAAIASLELLSAILSDIIAGKPLTPCGTEWHTHLYTQKELDEAQA